MPSFCIKFNGMSENRGVW